jgi:hypothetical protein
VKWRIRGWVLVNSNWLFVKNTQILPNFMNRKEKQRKKFKEELKSALISIKEVTEGKRKEVTLEEFLSKN